MPRARAPAPRSAARSPSRSPQTYRRLADPGPYRIDGRSIGRRALRNVCLAYLAAGDRASGARLRQGAVRCAARNMTDVLAALAVLVDIDCPERAAALDAFYRRWEGDPLVIDKWFALQARSALPGTIAAVRALTRAPRLHPRQPEPAARADRHLRAGQPAAFPRGERRRLRAFSPTRCSPSTRPTR